MKRRFCIIFYQTPMLFRFFEKFLTFPLTYTGSSFGFLERLHILVFKSNCKSKKSTANRFICIVVEPSSGWTFLGLLKDMGESVLRKTCHTYPTMMKRDAPTSYLKKIKKNMTHPLIFSEINIFSPEISTFVISRYTDVDCILIHNF